MTFHVVCFAWIFFRSDSFADAWDHASSASSPRWGEPSPLVTSGRARRDRRRHRLAVPPARASRSRSWRASPGFPFPAQAVVLALALMRHPRDGARRRGTVHLLPVLMETRETSTRRPRRRTAEGGRRLHSAGSAIVVSRDRRSSIALLLNAPGLHKSATIQPEGWKRDVALAVTGPLDERQRRAPARPAARGSQGSARTVGRRRGRHRGRRRHNRSRRRRSRRPTSPPEARREFTPEKKLRLWIAGDSLVVVPG